MTLWPSQSGLSSSGQLSEPPNGASARSASPDAWPCGDDSPARRDASELEAWWWRGLVIIDKSWFFVSIGVGAVEVEVRAEQFLWRAEKIPG